VGQIELVTGTRRSEDGVAQGHQERMDHDFGGEGGRFASQARDMAGLCVEELHPRVEMTHVRVGQVNERLDFRIYRANDVSGQQILDDDGPVLQERAYNLIGPCVSLNPLELSVVHC
jgi:hypothetical protein